MLDSVKKRKPQKNERPARDKVVYKPPPRICGIRMRRKERSRARMELR